MRIVEKQREKRVLRVFPRRTEMTPNDELARVGLPTLWDRDLRPDVVKISVVWTWDKERAEEMAEEWATVCEDVQVGGPAYGDSGGDFWPGMFVKHGNTITSRGCPNHCWFCDVPPREGKIRELPLMPGYNVLDNNLLACSDGHILKVFLMLEGQRLQPHFSGGLEAARLKPWHVEWFVRLRPNVMWFAYDTPDDYEPLVVTSKLLTEAGLLEGAHRCCCYVLAGWNRVEREDTIERAEKRVCDVVRLGFFPQAMLLDDGREWEDPERRTWKEWAARWINKKNVGKRMKKIMKGR